MNTNERGFIHDLATPLSSALVIADSLLDGLQDEEQAIDRQSLVSQLSVLMTSLEQVRDLMQNRRSQLIAQEEN